MPKQARIGDTVKIDCPHGPQVGIITTGSDITYDDGLKVARITDKVICTACGKSGQIITGSEYSYADGLKRARVTDVCVGTCDLGCKTCPHDRTGTIVTGSDFTYKE